MFLAPQNPYQMIRWPTSAITINSTVPFDRRQALFQPRYEIFSTIVHRRTSARHTLGRRLRSLRSNVSRVPLNFGDCRRNFVHVLFVAQQRKLRNPDRLPCGPLGMRKRLLQEWMRFRCLADAEAFPVLPIEKTIKVVQRRITRLMRNPFSVHGCDKVLRRDAGKVLSIHMKDVSVLAVPG